MIPCCGESPLGENSAPINENFNNQKPKHSILLNTNKINCIRSFQKLKNNPISAVSKAVMTFYTLEKLTFFRHKKIIKI